MSSKKEELRVCSVCNGEVLWLDMLGTECRSCVRERNRLKIAADNAAWAAARRERTEADERLDSAYMAREKARFEADKHLEADALLQAYACIDAVWNAALQARFEVDERQGADARIAADALLVSILSAGAEK